MFEAEQIQANMNAGPVKEHEYVILFSGKSVLLEQEGFPRFSQIAKRIPENAEFLRIGTWNKVSCFACWLPDLPGTDSVPVRDVFALYPESAGYAVSRARELVFWREQHRFCGACRAELRDSGTDLARICPECGMVYYPQIAPAVIVAVTRNEGRELLLAHNRNFADGLYSIPAGFVEAGETLEHAVERELFEETGIHVKNIRYISSQPWPFPNSLMLAFSAEYGSGTVAPDGSELTDAAFFPVDSLPQIPSRGSIARKVIDSFRRS